MKNNWPDNITIQQYLEGSLDKKLMHELEKRALEDPFLADAMEGYAHTSTTDHGLSILQRQLHERIGRQQENKKVFDLSWQRLSVAAAAAVMFISAGVLFWMNSQIPDKQLAANQKQVEVNLMPADSLNQKNAALNNTKVAETPINAKLSGVKSKTPPGNIPHANLNAAVIDRVEKTVVADNNGLLAAKEDLNSNQASSLKVSGDDSMQMATTASRKSQLSEVRLSSFAADPIERASPVAGWEAYRKYLNENIAKAAVSINQKGKVIVAFKVDQQGGLTDFKVLQGLSAVADSLAVQLIKGGPKWKPTVDGQVSELTIDLDF